MMNGVSEGTTASPNYLEQIDTALAAKNLEHVGITRDERLLVVRFRKCWSEALDATIREIMAIAVTGATIDECLTKFRAELEKY